MKKKTLAGLIAIVAIVAAVIFAGCIEEEAPTKVPETTPAGEIPKETLPLRPEPKYSHGDLLRAEGQSSEYAYLILNYDENNDRYQTIIVQLVDDKWTYTEEPKKWNDRDYIERTLGVIKIDHIDPATVAPYVVPTSTPIPTKESEILSHSSYIDGLGYFNVVGEVKNTLSSNTNYVKIVATFYDAQEKVIGTDFTYTELDILKPNQKSPFKLSSYPDKIDPASYKLKMSYRETGEEPFTGLKILSHSASIDKLGYHKIVGEVKNDGTKEATFVKVVCTYYGAGDKVIGTSFTYTDPDEIDAGDLAPFELSSYPRKLRPSSYDLQVQGK
jgi:hypothetical protein